MLIFHRQLFLALAFFGADWIGWIAAGAIGLLGFSQFRIILCRPLDLFTIFVTETPDDTAWGCSFATGAGI